MKKDGSKDEILDEYGGDPKNEQNSLKSRN
jgi:hypothetical protein